MIEKRDVLMNKCILSNGKEIPEIGFGTWHIKDEEQIMESITSALDAGYTHIDTASKYGNEEEIGNTLKRYNVNREDIFITSKLWNTDKGYENTKKAFNETLKKIKTDYLDLYLIHWAKTDNEWENLNRETWKAFEELYEKNKIRSIGVSNFDVEALESLIQNSKITPMVNQIEFHPGWMQNEIVEYCNKHNILIEAWSPIGSGRMLDNPDLINIAKKYNKSVAQLCIRWCIQNNVIPLPKSVTKERIIENIDVYDFQISLEDMEFINNMESFGWSGLNPNIIVK